MRMPRLNRAPERRSLAKDVLLSDKLIEIPRSHPHS
jgi:hypothetical protein